MYRYFFLTSFVSKSKAYVHYPKYATKFIFAHNNFSLKKTGHCFQTLHVKIVTLKNLQLKNTRNMYFNFQR